MDIDVVQVNVKPSNDHEGDLTKQRVDSLLLARRLTFVAIVFAVAQIVFNILHLLIVKRGLVWALLFSAVSFLGLALLALRWTKTTRKTFKKARKNLLEPTLDDRTTRQVFVLSVFEAVVATVLLVNLIVQRDRSPEYVHAQTTTTDIWNDHYSGRTEAGIIRFLHVITWVQVAFQAFFVVYFLITTNTSFKCFKYDNHAVSYLTFLSNVALLAFGIGLVYYANHALGYEIYPQVRSHFPMWNARALFFLGIAVATLALVGFLVSHRNWRVGFFVLAFLLLFVLVLLFNFTAFAFRHSGRTYNYYRGKPDITTCLRRLPITHWQELEDVGCPAKYVSIDECPANEYVTRWEGETSGEKAAEARDQSKTALPATNSIFATEADNFDFYQSTQFAAVDKVTPHCVNRRCCGLQGQIYQDDLLVLSNFGLLCILTAVVVSACAYYFWFAAYIDHSRNKSRDFIWLGIMVAIVVGWLLLWHLYRHPFVQELLAENGNHF